jgi:hypothetical protein
MAQYDKEKIREYYQKAITRTQAERYAQERNWFRNVLFLLGIQWIKYSAQSRKWTPRKMEKWVPRPVTNKFASVAMSMIQVLSQREPTARVTSQTNNPDDIAAAMVADSVLPVILEEANAEEGRNTAAAWMTLTGTVILHPCYDNDPIHGTTFVPHLQCQQCQQAFPSDAIQDQTICPQCQGPLQPGMNPDGTPMGEELPNGKMNIEVFSPFETYFDMEARSSRDIQQMTFRRRYPIDVIRRKFDRYDLEPDNNSNVGGAIGLNLLRAIAYAAGNSGDATGVASGRSLGDDQNVTIDCQWVRPCTDFPQGLVSYWANDDLLNEKTVKDGIPYHDSNGAPIWPWHIVKFDEVPGRATGKTPLDDVAPKQEQRNKLEAMIQLIISRTANPVWLIPKGLGVTEITGEPGQNVEGNWSIDPRTKPERVPGENVPTSLIAWLEKIDSDINDVSGIFEVLKGNAPNGITAGTALRLLLERAQTRFTPVAKHLEKAWQGVCKDLISIFQEYATDQRTAKIQGPGNTWEMRQFSKADVQGAIDVIVESGSALPKSIVGEQAMIQDLITMGLINPQQPEVQYKILERFGSTNLLGDTDENIKAAQRENWDFENEDKLPEMDLLIDLHLAHITVHKQLAVKSQFKEWPPQKQQAWRNHILEHMMAAAPAAMPMSPDGQPTGPDGKPTQEQGNAQQEVAPDINEAQPAGGVM